MTARRTPDFDLDHALADAGFTPRTRDVPALLDRVVQGGDAGALAEKALARVGLPAGRAAADRAANEAPGARAKLTRFVGRFAGERGGEALVTFLLERLSDPDERTRRAAATAVGKVRPAGADAALATALASETSVTARRALVEALGKVGGEGALEALAGAPPGDDMDARARLMVTRTLARGTPSTIDVKCAVPGPTRVALRYREGLERFLLDELDSDLGARVVHAQLGGTRIEATLTGSLERLFRARTMLSLAFPLADVAIGSPDELPNVIADALTSPEALALFRLFTIGPVRFRLAWAEGGKRRAVVWRAAAEVARRSGAGGATEIMNDPTESPWEAMVYEAAGRVRVELEPKVEDPRFVYRKRGVPAASHPTIAAALVRAAGVKPDDIVWDPFVGSGTELCERAIAGPYRLLIGSDRDANALPAAKENLAAAGARDVTLLRGDATVLAPPATPTLIITNPPLGRRVQRTADLAPMLDRFIEHVAKTLAPGGRFVWISPFPERTEAVARRNGLVLGFAGDVDMGGFTARLQAFRATGGRPDLA